MPLVSFSLLPQALQRARAGAVQRLRQAYALTLEEEWKARTAIAAAAAAAAALGPEATAGTPHANPPPPPSVSPSASAAVMPGCMGECGAAANVRIVKRCHNCSEREVCLCEPTWCHHCLLSWWIEKVSASILKKTKWCSACKFQCAVTFFKMFARPLTQTARHTQPTDY
jgi:hypothetical protein